MLYTSKKNKKTETIVVTCGCTGGCGSTIQIRTLDNEVFISTSENDFYTRQNNLKDEFEDRFKKFITQLVGKTVYVKDILLSEKEMNDFIKVGKNLYFEDKEENSGEENKGDNKEDTSAEFINESDIIIDAMKMGDGEPLLFSILIKAKKTFSPIKFLTGKQYKLYDIVMSKDEWNRFIETCEKYYNHCVLSSTIKTI